MKPIIGKWQFWFNPFGRAYHYIEGQGWHLFDAGFIKIRLHPGEGNMMGKEHYKGLIIRFAWWFPIDRAR